MKKIFLVIIFCKCMFVAFGQCQAIVQNHKEKIIYSISHDGYRKYDGYNFPEYTFWDSIIYNGYKPLNKDKDILCLTKEFNEPISVNINTTFLYLRIFVNHIKSYKVIIETLNGQVLTFDKNITFDKYQIPVYSFIDEWKNVGSLDLVDDSIYVKRLKIKAFTYGDSKRAEFIIADFMLMEYIAQTQEFNHPFFRQIAQKHYMPQKTSLQKINSTDLLSTFSEYSWHRSFNTQIIIKNNNLKTEESIKEVFRYTFEKYPFYQERNINKEQTMCHFDRIYKNDTIKGKDLWDSLRVIVNSFNDPHFSIPVKNLNRVDNIKSIGPVRLYGLFGNIYIASVFDTILIKHIKPGMQVIKIDNVPISQIFPSELYPNHKKVESLLYKNTDETTSLCLYNGKDTIEVKVPNNRKIIIPSNFIPKHGEFKKINTNTAYLRINHWDLDVNTIIYNNIDELKKSQSLIIDLRNNGGGHVIATSRLASLFISEPRPYLYNEYRWDESSVIKETQVIKPHPLFRLNHLKVVVLINAQSLCATEMFIDFMATNINSLTIIGAEKTQGALANVYNVMFEDGNVIRINSLAQTYTASQSILETKGIVPDIWVSINNISDLAPYDDKVLKTAITFLCYPDNI